MDNIASWVKEPLRQFTAFLASPAFTATSKRASRSTVSAESAAVYLHMFGKFTRWMERRHLTLASIGRDDLLDFLALGDADHIDLNSKIAYRYLRLIERCFIHLGQQDNPARRAIDGFFLRESRRLAGDRPMVAIDAEQIARFIAALPDHSWKRRRDRAMQLLMLCAGIRVAEAIGMLSSELAERPDLDGALQLSLTPQGKHPTSHAHVSMLDPQATPVLLAWLAERRELGIPGERLFPADPGGGALNKATVYRQVKASFERAGIDIGRAGGRTLRNSYAVQEIEGGASALALTHQLGLALTRSTEVYEETARKLAGTRARTARVPAEVEASTTEAPGAPTGSSA